MMNQNNAAAANDNRDSLLRFRFHNGGTLHQAIFESFSFEQKLALENMYETYTDIDEDEYDRLIYGRCRTLHWDRPTRDAITAYYRSQSENVNDGDWAAMEELRVQIRALLEQIFFRYCRVFGAQVESFTLIDLPHMPYDRTVFRYEPLSWFIPIANSGLRQFALQVEGVDPQFQYLPIGEQMLLEQFLLLFFRAHVYFRLCRTTLQRVAVITSTFPHFSLPADFFIRCTQYFAPYVRSIYFAPWAVTPRELNERQPYPRLDEYFQSILDIRDAQNRVTQAPSMLIDRWRTCCNRLAPPQQIRILHLRWIGYLYPNLLYDVLEYLIQFTALEILDLTLSFKVGEQFAEQSVQLFNTEVLQRFIAVYLGQAEAGAATHEWSYKNLNLIFYNSSTHMAVNPYAFEGQVDQHFSPTYQLYRLFTGEQAVWLRKLALAVTNIMEPLVIGAPRIELILLDFKYYENFPQLFRPVFGTFEHRHCVEELGLYNFFTPNEVILQQYYQQWFGHFVQTFPALKRVRLCSRESKSLSFNVITMRMEKFEDFFYIFNGSLVMEHLVRPLIMLTDLLLMDDHQKLYQFVVQLIEHFCRLAEANEGKDYLLFIQKCEIVLFDVTTRDELERRKNEYQQLLRRAVMYRNLRLVVPNEIKVHDTLIID